MVAKVSKDEETQLEDSSLRAAKKSSGSLDKGSERQSYQIFLEQILHRDWTRAKLSSRCH